MESTPDFVNKVYLFADIPYIVPILYLSCVYHVSHDSNSHKSPEIQTLFS